MKHTNTLDEKPNFDSSPETFKRIWNRSLETRIKTLEGDK